MRAAIGFAVYMIIVMSGFVFEGSVLRIESRHFLMLYGYLLFSFGFLISDLIRRQ
jgi:hypothetical protein